MTRAEFTATAFVAVEELGVAERLIEKLIQSTNDEIMLKRLATASDQIKNAGGYLTFVASRARAEMHQQDRQRDEVVRRLLSQSGNYTEKAVADLLGELNGTC